MKATGAKIIVECLLEQNVRDVFGYPGGQILDVFDELYKAKDKIRQILTAHEQGACHAADGYARVTGKAGVVISTSGPGATNLVTGIANAYMDSVPLVAITGNVGVPLLGRDSFQEVDIAGITMPITKHNYIVKNVNDLADTVREAFRIAQSGRPGPVLIDVPKNVQQDVCEYRSVKPEASAAKFNGSQSGIAEVAGLIRQSKRPLLYVGGGVIASNANEELLKFATHCDIPVSSSMMALGAFPATHPLFMGMIGMHGSAAAAKALSECDLLIALGARFSDRVATNRDKFGLNKKIAQIDIDIAEIDKNVQTDAHIRGDAKDSLNALLKILPKQRRPEWVLCCKQFAGNFPYRKTGKGLCGRDILKSIRANTPDTQIVATDVGQHQMWTVQSFPFLKPRTLITSGGLGTMGYGFGAAIGAGLASGEPVVLITGDGSFQMNCHETVTAVQYKVPVKIFLFNNNALGMVRQWQTLFYGKRYSSTTLDRPTDFVKLTEAFGAKAFTLCEESEIDSAVKKALAETGPVLVDCRIDQDAFVLPMIPAGKTADDIIEEWNIDGD